MALTTAQVAHLEKRLHEERARLVEQLNAFEDVEQSDDSQSLAGDLSNMPTHAADLGTDAINEAIEVSIGTRVSAELSEIDAALDRLVSAPATFGMDEETGEPIPFARLDIIPYARVNVK